jgi:hypothetical protein
MEKCSRPHLMETKLLPLTFANPRIEGRTALVLALGAVSLALLIGDIGFQGDDWWQFSFPFWNPLPQAIWEYARESRRPLEGIYTVLSFKLFGLNRVFYTLCALLLSAGSCLALGASLKRAFPERGSLAILTALFAFVFPSVSHLIYMFHTDNSRLSVLLFWVSVLAFQRWTMESRSWCGLVLPVVLYCLATLTYENTTFLIFAVPLWVWPIRVRSKQRTSDRAFLMRLAVGVGGGFVAFLAIRFGVFGGGAVGHRSLLPPLGLVFSYFSNLEYYCLAPFRDLSPDGAAWAWGLAFALLAAWLLWRVEPNEAEAFGREICREQTSPASVGQDGATGQGPHPWWGGWSGSPYVALMGIAVLVLGMLPYLMAGYRPDPAFTSQARVFSSASFGIPILLALLVTMWKKRTARLVASTVALAMLGMMAVFLAGLRGDWQAASERRNALYGDLLRQVPEVATGTTFLFLDLQSYIPESGPSRAVVFQGVDGLGEFVRMLYGRKDIYAYFLYPKGLPGVMEKGRTATALPQGLVARGSAIRPPIPLDSLLMFKREGTKLVYLDRISAKDGQAAVNWNDVSSLNSNKDLIRHTPGARHRLELVSGQSGR